MQFCKLICTQERTSLGTSCGASKQKKENMDNASQPLNLNLNLDLKNKKQTKQSCMLLI